MSSASTRPSGIGWSRLDSNSLPGGTSKARLNGLNVLSLNRWHELLFDRRMKLALASLLSVVALFAWSVLPLFAAEPGDASGRVGQALVYFGTYTTGTKSKGIYVSQLDLATGQLSPPELAAEVANPSYVALHPVGGFLY